MKDPVTVFALPGNEPLANSLADALCAPIGSITVREFPDGETYVRGETPCKGHVAVLAANLFRPNPTLLPLVYSAQATRVLGASRVILVSPYLPYMRQDARFQPGEVVTSRLFAKLLSDSVDGLVTVDPHLHRYNTLSEVYSIPTAIGHAAPAIASWIQSEVKSPVLIGPDRESEQWVREVADRAGAPYIVLAKTRHGDRDVEIEVPSLNNWRQHTPVLIDDIISTARTMIEVIEHLADTGFSAPVCVGVHGIFADDAFENLSRSRVARIVTCNTVPHESNAIDLTGALVGGLRCLFERELRDSPKE